MKNSYYEGRESDCGNYQDESNEPVKPFKPQTPIPMVHKISYWLNWALVITVIVILFS